MPNPSGGDNSGPANVDAKLWKHWPEGDELRCSQEHGWRHAAEIVRDSAWSDCVVADGWGRAQEIAQRVCHLLNKRLVCITHGWLPYENEVNGLGLSAIDALQAGTSLLLSDACGVVDTLALQDGDAVPRDSSAQFMAECIMALYKHPNAGRLAASIDYERYSWDAAAKRLRAICAGKGEYPLVSEEDKD